MKRKLGKRELEHESNVVQMAMMGMPDKDIAKSLGITVAQVNKLRRRDAERFAKKVRGMTPYDVIVTRDKPLPEVELNFKEEDA